MAETTPDMIRTGEALNDWYQVLFNDHDITEYADLAEALRGLSKMKDTDNNRDMLIVAATEIGLPEVDVNTLREWVNADRVKSDTFPADKGFFSADVRQMMDTELAVLADED